MTCNRRASTTVAGRHDPGTSAQQTVKWAWLSHHATGFWKLESCYRRWGNVVFSVHLCFQRVIQTSYLLWYFPKSLSKSNSCHVKPSHHPSFTDKSTWWLYGSAEGAFFISHYHSNGVTTTGHYDLQMTHTTDVSILRSEGFLQNTLPLVWLYVKITGKLFLKPLTEPNLTVTTPKKKLLLKPLHTTLLTTFLKK